MSNIWNVARSMKNWRIDTDDNSHQMSPSTPIITILPTVEEPQKVQSEENHINTGQRSLPRQSTLEWLFASLRSLRPNGILKSLPGTQSELQNMMPSVEVHKTKKNKKSGEDQGGGGGGGGAPGVCLMTESPFRILRVRIDNNKDCKLQDTWKR